MTEACRSQVKLTARRRSRLRWHRWPDEGAVRQTKGRWLHANRSPQHGLRPAPRAQWPSLTPYSPLAPSSSTSPPHIHDGRRPFSNTVRFPSGVVTYAVTLDVDAALALPVFIATVDALEPASFFLKFTMLIFHSAVVAVCCLLSRLRHSSIRTIGRTRCTASSSRFLSDRGVCACIRCLA